MRDRRSAIVDRRPHQCYHAIAWHRHETRWRGWNSRGRRRRYTYAVRCHASKGIRGVRGLHADVIHKTIDQTTQINSHRVCSDRGTKGSIGRAVRRIEIVGKGRAGRRSRPTQSDQRISCNRGEVLGSGRTEVRCNGDTGRRQAVVDRIDRANPDSIGGTVVQASDRA